MIASGIATDYYSRDFFQDLIKNKQLVSLYDFENSNGLFPVVHKTFKFSLLTLTGNNLPVQQADFAFFLTMLEQLRISDRKFSLSATDIELPLIHI